MQNDFSFTSTVYLRHYLNRCMNDANLSNYNKKKIGNHFHEKNIQSLIYSQKSTWLTQYSSRDLQIEIFSNNSYSISEKKQLKSNKTIIYKSMFVDVYTFADTIWISKWIEWFIFVGTNGTGVFSGPRRTTFVLRL